MIAENKQIKLEKEDIRFKVINWLIFICLSLIWGSSFKLMKVGMNELSSYQVASLRMLSAGIFLLPATIKYIKSLSHKQIGLIIISGLMGNFIPAYLFCIAETRIDSSLAGIINSLMAIFVIVIGKLFFNLEVKRQKILGTIIAFTGLCFLLLSKSTTNLSDSFYSLMAVLATVCYGINSNLISKTLKNISSLQIISVSMSLLSIPALTVLFITGYFSHFSITKPFLLSTGASVFLGVFGTAIASGTFYVLIKRAGSVFASLVTNVMPIVAIFWGVLSGESITALDIFYFCIIMSGVYLTGK